MKEATARNNATRTRGGLFVVGIVGMGLLAFACKQDSSSQTEGERAQAASGRADQLRTQATKVEQVGEQRANDMRAQAGTVERQAERSADQIRAQADHAAQTPEPVTAPIMSVAAAREQYAEARCNREVACHNVGTGHEYPSMQACMTTARADRYDGWNAATCTHGGIDSARFEACLSAVRAQSCGNPIDEVTRLNDCRAGTVCRSNASAMR